MDTNNIIIEENYNSGERAEMDGYSFLYYSSRLGGSVYCKDTNAGRSYAIVK